MGLSVRRMSQNAVQYSANNKVSENLARGLVYRELELTLTAQPTVAGAANIAANIGRGDEWSLISRIEIIANGTTTIKSISGASLRLLNYLWYGQTPTISAGLGDGATANINLRSTLILPFWMPNVVRPLDTALNSADLSGLTINVTWSDETKFNSAATGFTTSPTLAVESLEHFGGTGKFGQWRTWEMIKEVTATSPKFQMSMPVGSLFSGFTIITEDAGVETDAVISSLKVVSGSTVFMSGDFKTLRDSSNRRYSRVNLPAGVSANNNMDGVLDFSIVTDGFLTESIDTAGYSELTMEFDVTKGAGTTNITVIPNMIVPVRAVA